MQVQIKSSIGGWAWSLVTDEGRVYIGHSSEWSEMWRRLQDLNAKVLELKAERVT